MKAVVVGLGVVGRTMVALGGPGTIGVDRDRRRLEICRETAGDAVEDPQVVADADLVFVCVGTPRAADGSQDTSQVVSVLKQLRMLVRPASCVAIRSTILPEVMPADFPCPVVVNPEFLRATSPVFDAIHPPFIVAGSENSEAAHRVLAWYDEAGIPDTVPRFVVGSREAILLKFACNWFHALKVEFANTVADASRTWGAAADEVMEIFCRDRILNISERYLRPGKPFGGDCLPKDLDAGVAATGAPLLRVLAESNRSRMTAELEGR